MNVCVLFIALGHVLKVAGTEALDTFSDLVDQFGADIQEGAALRADFASEASMAGAYAVSALAKDTDTSDPMVTRFVIAVKQPSKLVSATESAALGVGHRVSCAWPLPSEFPPRGSRLLLAQESLLSC